MKEEIISYINRAIKTIRSGFYEITHEDFVNILIEIKKKVEGLEE